MFEIPVMELGIYYITKGWNLTAPRDKGGEEYTNYLSLGSSLAHSDYLKLKTYWQNMQNTDLEIAWTSFWLFKFCIKIIK